MESVKSKNLQKPPRSLSRETANSEHDLDEQGQVSLQLLHENTLSAQKKRQNVGIATAVQIESTSSSPMKNPASSTASEMANMINSSRSIGQLRDGIGAEERQGKSNRTLPGKLRKVVQSEDPRNQRYGLRSKTNDAAISQTRTANPNARLDTYDINNTSEYNYGSSAQNNLSQGVGKDEAVNLQQDKKKSTRKSKRNTSKQTRSEQISTIASAEVDDAANRVSEEDLEGSNRDNIHPIPLETPTDHCSKLASTKARRRPRRVHNEKSLTLRQSQPTVSDKFYNTDRNKRLNSPKTGQRENGAHAEPSHEDDTVKVHRDTEFDSLTHRQNANTGLGKLSKRAKKRPKSASDHVTTPRGTRQELECNEARQGTISQQTPEERILTSDDESIQTNEEFRPEDMFAQGYELNALFANAFEMSEEPNVSGDNLCGSLLDDFKEKGSKLRAFIKEQSCDDTTRHSEHNTIINNRCSEIFDSLRVLVNEMLKSDDDEDTFRQIYAIVMTRSALIFHDLLWFFRLWSSEEEGLYLEGFGLDIAIELAHCVESSHEAAKSIKAVSGLKSKASSSKTGISKKIVKPMKKICKVFEEERDALVAAEEAQASSFRREEEISYNEKRKARLRERRERAEARRDEWHSLHVARLAAEPDPRRFAHLRLRELASEIDLDANGEFFERLELFTPRTQASPAVLQTQHKERDEWTDAELAALLDGLKAFAGPSVFYNVFATYCCPGRPLRSYNVQQITRKATYLRRILMQADLAQNRESEDWIKHIPVYE